MLHSFIIKTPLATIAGKNIKKTIKRGESTHAETKRENALIALGAGNGNDASKLGLGKAWCEEERRYKNHCNEVFEVIPSISTLSFKGSWVPGLESRPRW